MLNMKSLRKLYQANKRLLIDVREALINEDLKGPFLMELDEYYQQSVKLFIIGQESHGWCCEYENHVALLSTYTDFNMGANHSSPFWNITRKIENIIGIPSYSCAWSNINRYDHNGGEPKGEILNEIRKLDFLVKEELSVIQPDVCFFFTNRKYDYRLEELFSGLVMQKIEKLPPNHFCRLKHQDLPSFTFRTPHPITIRTQKWEELFFSVMKELLPKAVSTQASNDIEQKMRK